MFGTWVGSAVGDTRGASGAGGAAYAVYRGAAARAWHVGVGVVTLR